MPIFKVNVANEFKIFFVGEVLVEAKTKKDAEEVVKNISFCEPNADEDIFDLEESYESMEFLKFTILSSEKADLNEERGQPYYKYFYNKLLKNLIKQ